jgi:hypothetical protein
MNIINGYLTQQKLQNLLQNEPALNYINKEVPLEGSRLKFDFLVERNSDKQKIAIEFNGYAHYTDPDTILRDFKKREYAKKNNLILVEIPYWVQINEETFKHYFQINPLNHIKCDYFHGFIDKKAKLPSCFCSLGIERFIIEFLLLPVSVKLEIQKSLKDQVTISNKDPRAVYFQKFEDLIN